MHLQHEVNAELHVLVISVDRIKHIAIARDFLLRSITGLDLFLNELNDSIVPLHIRYGCWIQYFE